MTVLQARISRLNKPSGTKSRILVGLILASTASFMINNVFTFWFGAPGVLNLFAHFELFGLSPDSDTYSNGQILAAICQLGLYILSMLVVIAYVLRSAGLSGLIYDAKLYADIAAFIIRAAFWSVILVGVADVIVSFLRVEEFLAPIIGETLTNNLGRPQFRGVYMHYPLVGVATVVALFTRSLSFIWLAVLVVFSEFSIVITRFVFSYEQAFMGDLVRFWYAALFLFASSYALITEGHVRVDVAYTHFGERKKAWANAIGSLALGMPICLTILVLGMWGRGSSLNGPLLSYEISQSGFGMYVKYLMAAFLVVYALSMLVQFAAYFLENMAVLLANENNTRNKQTPVSQPN